jgi:NifB/MoaA-like Fe-S oxidoreductase
MHPGVQSVAIVPVGLSDYGKPRERLSPITPDFCRKVIQAASRWQEKFRSQTGSTFAYLSDEFYIQGGVAIPERAHYDDFAQIEDGIGMVRSFLDEFEAESGRRRKLLYHLHGTLVTGKLFAPILKRCITRFNRKFGSRLQVLAAENSFLGKSITVAGLLAGQDILRALRGRNVGNFLIFPNEAISQVEGIMLDDLSPKELSNCLGKPVYASGRTMRDFFGLLFRLVKRPSL